jgi:hypothetical protein
MVLDFKTRYKDIYNYKVYLNEVFMIDASKLEVVCVENADTHLWSYKISRKSKIIICDSFICALNNSGNEDIVLNQKGKFIIDLFANEKLSVHPYANSIDNKLIVRNSDNGICLYDLEKLSTVWKSSFETGILCLQTNLLLITTTKSSSNELMCINKTNGSLFWIINVASTLNKSGEVINIIGTYSALLILCIKRNISTFELVALNINTGAVAWALEDLGLLYGYTAKINEETGSILSLRAQANQSYYLEVDIVNASIKRYGEIDELYKLGLSIADFTVHDKFIYFTAHYMNSFGPEAIGILNYETLELLWWEHVKLDEGAFFGVGQKPVVEEDRLYILDTKGTLHIYEKFH